jgi:PPM family protein phosphatase
MTESAIPAPEASGNGRFDAHASTGSLAWALRSDPGLVRDHNEDCAGAWHDGDDRGPLFVVADGMGGHVAGEVASRLAVDAALADWTTGAAQAPQAAIRNAVRKANLSVFDAALEQGKRGMGTTIVAATLAGREAVVAHVGDSRAYLVHDDRCTQLTADHSRVAEMVRMKLITPEQAANHPARSMLTRSLGGDPMVQVDVNRHPVEHGDVLVLCSDGVWDLVSRNELSEATRLEPSRAAEHIVELALKRGAPDNVTVLLVAVTSAEPVAAASGRRSLFGRKR